MTQTQMKREEIYSHADARGEQWEDSARAADSWFTRAACIQNV